jgi:hypothetical protein
MVFSFVNVLFIYIYFISTIYKNTAVNEADHLCHQMSTAVMSAFYFWVEFNLCAINDFIIIIIIIIIIGHM